MKQKKLVLTKDYFYGICKKGDEVIKLPDDNEYGCRVGRYTFTKNGWDEIKKITKLVKK